MNTRISVSRLRNECTNWLIVRLILVLGLLHLMASIALAQYFVTTHAGNGEQGFAGDGGPATSARLHYPGGLTLDAAGNLFITDTYNHRIRKVTPDGRIQTVAGNGIDGNSLGSLSYPNGVAVDSTGNLFIADGCNSRILKVAPEGTVTIFASGFVLCDSFSGEDPYPTDVLAVDANDNLFVLELFPGTVFKISPSGVMSTVASSRSLGSGYSGDGGPATEARLASPQGIAVDAAGNLFIADTYNSRIRKVTPDGIITTVAGVGEVYSGYGFSGDGGPAISARLSFPAAVEVDIAGNLLIADSGNGRIRQVTPDGIINTIAGNGSYNFGGDGGPAMAAAFAYVAGLGLDARGNLYIADSNNHRVRRTFSGVTPMLTAVSQDVGAPGTSFTVTFNGAGFFSPLTVPDPDGIRVSNVQVMNETTATATLTVASDAVTGPRDIAVATVVGTSNPATFTVVAPFPDLSVTSTQSGTFSVGSNGSYTLAVRNVGAADTSGEITLTDRLPAGLTYVSGAGNGWACSASGSIVACENPGPLAAGDSTSVTLTVAVRAAATGGVTHQITVDVAGDRVSSNNSLDSPVVAAPFSPSIRFTGTETTTSATPGRQARVQMTLPEVLPFDVTGTLTLTFTPEAVNPVDDPAIQFATGGRQIPFVFPANTLEARFSGSTPAGSAGFQTGTVAGTLTFEATFQTDVVSTTTSSVSVPRRMVIRSVQINATPNGPEVLISIVSTTREVAQMTLSFYTQPPVRVSCGSAAGCTASESVPALRVDVKPIFDSWYAGDSTYGGLSQLRFPLLIQGTVQGTAKIILRDSADRSSASADFPLPR